MEGFSGKQHQEKANSEIKQQAPTNLVSEPTSSTTITATRSLSPTNDSSANYPKLPTNNNEQQQTSASSQNYQNPNYSTVYNPNSYKLRSLSPTSPTKQDQQDGLTSARRSSLKKQGQIELSTESQQTSSIRKSSTKKSPIGTNYFNSVRLQGSKELAQRNKSETALDDDLMSAEDEEYGEGNSNNNDEEYDEDEDEVDERFPFSSVNGVITTKEITSNNNNNNNKRAGISKLPNKQMLFDANETYIDGRLKNKQRELKAYNSHNSISSNKKAHHNPHTKISFNSESRPPSFSTCQVGFQPHIHHGEGSNDPICAKCNCSDCCKKRKATMFLEMQHNHQNAQLVLAPKIHSRTRALHLVLKSIILVLLTLLLFMFTIGIIVASHYLPQVFDRLLNVSRSFNVTIAG